MGFGLGDFVSNTLGSVSGGLNNPILNPIGTITSMPFGLNPTQAYEIGAIGGLGASAIGIGATPTSMGNLWLGGEASAGAGGLSLTPAGADAYVLPGSQEGMLAEQTAGFTPEELAGWTGEGGASAGFGNLGLGGLMGGGGGGGTSLMRMGMGGLSMASGIGQIMQGRQLSAEAGQADPYSNARQQWLQQLQDLESGKTSISSTPGYEAGLEALQRTLAAQGYTGSGKAQTELLNYGGNIYNQRVQQLSQLASMGDPSAPGRMRAQAMQAEGGGLSQLGMGAALAFL